MEYNKKSNDINHSKIWQTLILQNCLPLGKGARFTSNNVAQYLLGSRNNYNLFKFNEIKHLLLKFTPLIETLFRSKLVLQAKIGGKTKTRFIKPTPPKDPEERKTWVERMKNVKITKYHTKNYYQTIENKRPVKILFASTNPVYTEIIKESAKTCHMSAKTHRWMCGYITANLQTLAEKSKLLKELKELSGQTKIEKQIKKTFKDNYEAREYRAAWHNLNSSSHRPALMIIPDIENNDMILRETSAKDIPVIGLVNSDEATKISYPIFGNSTSIQTVHFFCNFLALIIAKTFIQQEYKQSSHRIINTTRAFFSAIQKRKLTINSVDAYSKDKILVHQNLVPTLKRWKRGKIRKYVVRPDTQTRQIINKNISNLLKFKFNKKVKKPNTYLNTQRSKLNNNMLKLNSIGKTPYWKNVKSMILALQLKLRSYNTNIGYNPKTHKIKKVKTKTTNKKNLQINTMAKVFYVKKKVRGLRRSTIIDKILLKRYTDKLKALKSINVKSLRKVKTKKSLRKPLTIEVKLKKALIRNQKKLYKNFRVTIKTSRRLQKEHGIKKTKAKEFKYLNPVEWRAKNWPFLVNKRKAFVKAFGHKHTLKKFRRHVTQWHARGRLNIRWRRELKEINYRKMKAQKKFLEKIFFNNPEKLANITRIYNKLLVSENKQRKVREIRGYSLHFKRMWKNKNVLNSMLKKYRYLTLLLKSSMFTPQESRKMLPINILYSEFTNYNTKPYKFNMTRFKRSKTIAHNIFWQKLYVNNWKLKAAKQSFVQKSKLFWLASKLKAKGKIRSEFVNNDFDAKRAQHLQKQTVFPKFVTKFKRSKRSYERDTDIRNYKSMSHYIWYLEKAELKIQRAKKHIPIISKYIYLNAPKFERIPRKQLYTIRGNAMKRYKEAKAEHRKRAKYLGVKAEKRQWQRIILNLQLQDNLEMAKARIAARKRVYDAPTKAGILKQRALEKERKKIKNSKEAQKKLHTKNNKNVKDTKIVKKVKNNK